MKTTKLTFILTSAFLLSALSSFAAQLSSAKVLAVEGTVSKYSDTEQNIPVSAGDILVEGDSISVTALSSAQLVFSNGSQITVKENTSFTLSELSQQPFSGGSSYEQLQADPSVSQTLLQLNYGELDFHVKKLQNGSSFDIETPLGTAAIRGTQGTARLLYNADRGEFIFFVSNEDGLVDVISRYQGEITFSDSNVADKGYDSGVTNDVSEPIPQEHTVIIRLTQEDPLYDDLLNAMINFIPTEVPTSGTIELPFPEFTPEDPGIIVISPEGRADPVVEESPGDDSPTVDEPTFDDSFSDGE
jgi:hypothetical protein